jgi:Condensation domain
VILREVPASIGQRLLWLMDRYRGEHGGLNTTMSVRLRGDFHLDAWTASVTAAATRHEALRTTFAGRGRRLTQLVHAPAPVPVDRADVTPAELDARLSAHARAPLDIERRPVRVSVWRLGPADHVLSLTLHHLVNDAWSFDVLWRDLCRRYTGLVTGAAATDRPPPRWQFADFAAWQAAEVATGPRFAELEAHWRERLAGARFVRVPGRTATPRRRPGPAPPRR